VLVVIWTFSVRVNTVPVTSFGAASARVGVPSMVVSWGVTVVTGVPLASTETQIAVAGAWRARSGMSRLGLGLGRAEVRRGRRERERSDASILNAFLRGRIGEKASICSVGERNERRERRIEDGGRDGMKIREDGRRRLTCAKKRHRDLERERKKFVSQGPGDPVYSRWKASVADQLKLDCFIEGFYSASYFVSHVVELNRLALTDCYRVWIVIFFWLMHCHG